jgi:hypothetical protein
MSKDIRLTTVELNTLRTAFKEFFGQNDSLWLFGSRADPNKKGGDIDLYIEAHHLQADEAFNKKIRFLVAIKDQIGEQKIDVVLKLDGYDELPIYAVAKETGIKLI